MPRSIKPAASPHTALLRARARREQVRLAGELREERKKARQAKAHADKLAAMETTRRLALAEARRAPAPAPTDTGYMPKGW